jgi:urease accessory protein
LFTEKFLIQPRERNVRQTGIMGPYDVFGNVVLLTPKHHVDCILEQTGTDANNALTYGATRLPNDAGVIFNVLGMESTDVKKKIYEFWSAARLQIAAMEAPKVWFWR